MNNSLKTIFKRLYEKTTEEDVLGSAAQVGFYLAFSLFPLILFSVSLFGLFLGSEEATKQAFFGYFERTMPVAAFELLKITIDEITTSASKTALALALGLITALWSSSAGIDSLRTSLNRIYGFAESKSWLRSRLRSILVTIVVSFLLIVNLAMVFLGTRATIAVASLTDLSSFSFALIGVVQWVIRFVTTLMIFEALYTFLPNGKTFEWYRITPGAIVGTAIWLLFSEGFRDFLYYFGSYGPAYGTISSAMVLLIWLYLQALVILIGSMINAILLETREDLSTKGAKE